jgi:hypothetical protein
LLLSERVRIEVFIPDLPDPSYAKLLTQFQSEFSYTFGGCTVISASGTFLSGGGMILPDKISILFADVLIGQYTDRVKTAVRDSLKQEEAIMISVYSVYHDE